MQFTDGFVIRAIGQQPIKSEFIKIELGDHRLSRRLEHLAELLGSDFQSNLPKACVDWKEIKAAYRFFSNNHVDPEKIQNTHFQNTLARMVDLEADPILLVQDSSSFNYNSHRATSNLGSLGSVHGVHRARGIHCHSGLLYTTHGTPLGIVFQKFWLRKNRRGQAEVRASQKRRSLSIKRKESFRWLQVIQVANSIQKNTNRHVIVVSDREGAINEAFRFAIDSETKFIARVGDMRTCINSKTKFKTVLIKNHLKSRPFGAQMELAIAYRKPYGTYHLDNKRRSPKHRKALIQIWWKEVTISLNSRSRSPKHWKKVTAILAEESPSSCPNKRDRLLWLILTNEKVQTQEDATKIITYYKCRWQIEEYWRIWKSGCRVEDCRLGDSKKLIRYLKIMGVVAWRQHYLTEIGREFPNLPASECLTPSEIKALQIQSHKTLNSNLTLGEAWHLISKLGGFMNRKSDNNPGPTTFWRGLQKIEYTAQGVEGYWSEQQQTETPHLKAAKAA
jgi:hypothetical protein